MASYDIKVLQQRILQILIAVDKVCKEHNLRYYLWAGTQLGAVRHGGFIPWDDDMDIAMPRPDYERFLAHAHEWLPKPFEAVCAENDSSCMGGFGKVLDTSTTVIERKGVKIVGAIYIDIFPLDGMPSSSLLQRWQIMRHKFINKLIYFYHRDPYKHGHGPSSWMPLLVQKLFTRDGLQRRIRKIMTKYSYDDCRLIADYDDGLRGPQPKEFTGDGAPISFEGVTLIGVAKPHEYLSQKYGSDYMIPPPENKRRQHNFYYLDLNHPYRDYQDDRR